MVTKNKILICKVCKAQFTSLRDNTLYCSPDCRRKGKRDKLIIKKNIPISYYHCLNCGKEFKKRVHNQIFCSKECQKIIIKQRYLDSFNNPHSYLPHLKLRFEIFKRDNFTCQYCGRNVREDGIKLNIDHIIPISKGGKTIVSNLVTSCKECNAGKTDCLLSNIELKKYPLVSQKQEMVEGFI